MLISSLIVIPLLASIVACGLKSDTLRRLLLGLVALSHLVLCGLTWTLPSSTLCGGWIELDPLGRLFLSVISLTFAAVVTSLVGTWHADSKSRADSRDPVRFLDDSEALISGCLLVLLSSMTLATCAQHLGVLWMMLQISAVSSLPLCFHRRTVSTERAGFSILTSSIGLTLVLLGNYLLTMTLNPTGERISGLLISHWLLLPADTFQSAATLFELKLLFPFVIVGLGLSLGLAPLHSWLHEVQSEASPAIAALISGAFVNCMLLGLLRMLQIYSATGLNTYIGPPLVGLGLLTLACAIYHLARAKHVLQLVSSFCIAQMGIQILGLGIGGTAVGGSVMLIVSGGLTRCLLFLVAGQLIHSYQTRSISGMTGLWRMSPLIALLWILCLLTIAGLPPSIGFFTQLMILKGAFNTSHFGAGGVFLLLSNIIAIMTFGVILRMGAGLRRSAAVNQSFLQWHTMAPCLILGLLIVILGCHIPRALVSACQDAARMLGGAGW